MVPSHRTRLSSTRGKITNLHRTSVIPSNSIAQRSLSTIMHLPAAGMATWKISCWKSHRRQNSVLLRWTPEYKRTNVHGVVCELYGGDVLQADLDISAYGASASRLEPSSRRFCRSQGVRVSASPGIVFRGLGSRSDGCPSDLHDELPRLGTRHLCFTFLGQPYRPWLSPSVFDTTGATSRSWCSWFRHV